MCAVAEEQGAVHQLGETDALLDFERLQLPRHVPPVADERVQGVDWPHQHVWHRLIGRDSERRTRKRADLVPAGQARRHSPFQPREGSVEVHGGLLQLLILELLQFDSVLGHQRGRAHDFEVLTRVKRHRLSCHDDLARCARVVPGILRDARFVHEEMADTTQNEVRLFPARVGRKERQPHLHEIAAAVDVLARGRAILQRFEHGVLAIVAPDGLWQRVPQLAMLIVLGVRSLVPLLEAPPYVRCALPRPRSRLVLAP
mmetsp:Transcript_25807/g.78428  ORF Transcript_25807/g.78428 Transcript_25807/m.78428 type:complete len:258 (-) Transcript_25807:1550-2323(-)